MKRIFILLVILFSIMTVYSQNLVKAEYFIGPDPGQGNGTSIPNFTPGDTVSFSFSVPTTSLGNGFHFLSTRVADADGRWTRFETKGFYLSTTDANTTNIVAAEYYFDSDPGNGNGTAVNIGSPGSVVNFVVNIPVALNPGFHFLSIRVKDEEGKWSLFEQRGFYKVPSPENAEPIVAIEYFYDTDPGFGNGTRLAVNQPGDTVDQTFLVPVPTGLSQGEHLLAIRAKDQAGHWSFLVIDTITVSNTSTVTCPANVIVSAAAGQCTAIVNGIDPTASGAYTYTLTGATIGSGSGTASGKPFNVGLTTVTYALSNSPTTNCSFTVTVNSSIVPSVSIQASSTSACTLQMLTFTASPTNGGGQPTYQWQKNDVNVGDGTNIYQWAGHWFTGDVVRVIMTSSIACANPVSDTSDQVTITVVPPYLTPTLNIVASTTTICPGTPVTFTATSTYGGVPWYSWKINGNYVNGANDSVFQTSALVNGDRVVCIMTSSLACVTDVTTISNEIIMEATQNVSPQVMITTPQTTICSGTNAIFSAISLNGGPNPTYQWKVNGINVGLDSSIYESFTLNSGDVVSVIMSSSIQCASPQTVTSNGIIMTVLPSTPAVVNINASATTICSGTNVTFNVTSVNPGATYQWQLNGVPISGATGLNYQSSSLQNGDKIKVIMTPATPCTFPSPAHSNEITMTVNTSTATTVTIAASDTTICYGQTVIFTATPVNAGTNPAYEWILNSNVVGTSSPVYQSSSIQNGDVVKLTMSSFNACGNNTYAISNIITMSVGTNVQPSVSISANNTTICANTSVTFTATPINGGGNPNYQWKLNGANVGTNSPVYGNSGLVNGDAIEVIMTSSLTCASPLSDTSNRIIMVVTQPLTFYRDFDGDGYGKASSGTILACLIPTGYVTNNTDCDDNNPLVNPGATEVCGNDDDENCNQIVDETCHSNLPILLTRTYPVKEGDQGYTLLNMQVSLDSAVSFPVSVNFRTSSEDATQGQDYQATSGTLQIPAGSTSAPIQLIIYGDLLREGNERFAVQFSQPVNAYFAGDSVSHVMIIDNDKGKNNKSLSPVGDEAPGSLMLTIPTVTRRNSTWMIAQIGNYQNEVMITNTQGQVVRRFKNYRNDLSLGNIAEGLYFYRIQTYDIKDGLKIYNGRLLVTE